MTHTTWRRFLRILHDWRWELNYRVFPKHRYHLIRTGLAPGYYDEDELMLHGVMALIGRYVKYRTTEGTVAALEEFGQELVDGSKLPDTYVPSVHGEHELKVAKIQRWWVEQYPKDEAEKDRLQSAWHKSRDETLWEQLQNMEQKIAKDEQDFLHMAVDVRPGLWT